MQIKPERCSSALILSMFSIMPMTIHAQGQPIQRINLDKSIVVEFDKKQYTLTQAQAAAGVKFPYRIVVKEDLPGMIPSSQTSAALPSGSGLLPLAKITGNRQFYGIVDVGLGPGVTTKPKTIKKGTYKQTLKWDGRNWHGPSDFGAPKGKPFPPGTYELTVTMIGRKMTAAGSRNYRIANSIKIVITK